jgi:hypothetical protein
VRAERVMACLVTVGARKLRRAGEKEYRPQNPHDTGRRAGLADVRYRAGIDRDALGCIHARGYRVLLSRADLSRLARVPGTIAARSLPGRVGRRRQRRVRRRTPEWVKCRRHAAGVQADNGRQHGCPHRPVCLPRTGVRRQAQEVPPRFTLRQGVPFEVSAVTRYLLVTAGGAGGDGGDRHRPDQGDAAGQRAGRYTPSSSPAGRWLLLLGRISGP